MTPYELVRSDRRTLAVEITRDCRVLVRAPRRMPRSQIDAFVAGRERWITEHMERQRQRLAAHPEPTEAEREACVRRAREVLPRRAAHYAALMGVRPAGITITGARTRFGSCNSQGRICFSWRLMLYPEEAIDYVVVHELAHLRHMDHSERFYGEVARVLPDWQRRRALLRV